MKYPKALISIASLCTLFSSLAHSDDLVSVYRAAEIYDAQLRAATAAYNAQQQLTPISRANLLPQLSGSVNASTTETDVGGNSSFVIPGTNDVAGYSIDLRQSIYNHGSWQQLKQANASVAQAEAEYHAARQDLMLRTASAYFTVLASLDNLEFVTAEKKAVGQQLEQAKQRFEVGLIAITDVKESQAQYDQAVAAEIEARNIVAAARESLRVITYRYPEQIAPLSDNLPLIKPDPADKQQWVDKALAENLSLIAARFARTASEYAVAVQRSGHYPDLAFVAQRNFADTDSDLLGNSDRTDTTYGINLSIPLYSGGGVSARVKEALFQLEFTREQQEATRRSVIEQTRNAYATVIAEISRVEALKQALVSSEAAYEATNAGFEVGTRNAVEVLLSLRNLFRAKRDYAQARYDYLLNTLQLKQAVGSLNVMDLQAINNWLQ